MTLVANDSGGVKSTKIELTSEEQSKGKELEEYIVSELVRRHAVYV